MNDRPPRDLIVSLDGPGSSGKSSVGAGAARRLEYRFCDTGLLYRALTWLALERSVSVDDGDALAELVREVSLVESDGGRLDGVRVGSRDVTALIRGAQVDHHVSSIARHPAVRAVLLVVQRGIARPGRIIMAGRDIGTVVLPDADLKVYLDVSVEVRAWRRAEERGAAEDPDAVAAIEADLRRRDEIDSSRETAPLRVPEGAVIVRSDGKRLEETVEVVVSLVRSAAARAGDAQ